MRALAILLLPFALSAQDTRGKVAAACAPVDCDRNPHAHPPMQSVFKLPLAITVLHLVEQRTLSLDQPVRFLPTDRILPRTYSPLQDRYPEGGVDVPLRDLLPMAVSMSDNVAADMLLRIIGGPKAVDDYIRSIGVQGFHLEDNEASLHRDGQAQYRNWFEPAGAVALLRLLDERSPLNRDHTRLLLRWMEDTPTGARRIKGQLPAGTRVMHKTGSSAETTNDIGIVALPGGRRLYVAVFVTDAPEDLAAREAVIAGIARTAYEAASAK